MSTDTDDMINAAIKETADILAKMAPEVVTGLREEYPHLGDVELAVVAAGAIAKSTELHRTENEVVRDAVVGSLLGMLARNAGLVPAGTKDVVQWMVDQIEDGGGAGGEKSP